jgi:outer membrane protein
LEEILGGKMKYLKLVLLVTMLTPGSLLAQRVAVINFDRVVAESLEGRVAGAELEEHYNSLAADLEAEQASLEEMQNRLATQERVLSPAALAGLNRDIQNTQTRLTRASEDAQLEMQATNDELLLPIFEKAQLVFQEYADEQQFTLIFNIAAEGTGLIYAAPSIDITNEIIRRMDDAAAGAATQAPEPAAPDLAPPAP